MRRALRLSITSMKRVARIVAVLGAASIAACFTKPDAPHAGDRDGGVDAPDSRMTDAKMIDAAVACTKDTFDNTLLAPCGTWGTATMSTDATLSRASMTLDFNFTNSSASASCATTSPINITNGTSIHVLQFANSLTSFSLTLDGSQVSTFNVTYNGSMYSSSLACPGASVNNPTVSSMPPASWWQFRVTSPNNGVARVAIELSATGDLNSWSEFQSCTFNEVNIATGDVKMAGSGSGTTSVKFDDFNVKNCP
jgi:hypothetical protein